MRQVGLQIFLLLWPFLLYSKPLQMRPPELQEILPKSVITLPFVLENEGDQEIVGELKAEGPEGWKILGLRSKIGVSAHGKKTVILSVLVPRDSLSDRLFPVTLEFESPEGNFSATSLLRVQALPDLNVQLLAQETLAFAGETVKFVFLVENRGNGKDAYELCPKQIHDWPLKGPRRTRILEPGEGEEVTFCLTVPNKQRRPQINQLTLRVQSIMNPKEVQSILKAQVRSIPQDDDLDGIEESLPTTLSVSTAPVEWGDFPTSKVRIAGAGTLADEYDVEFSAIGKYLGDGYHHLNARDQRGRLDVDAENWGFSLGDTNARFSRLTPDLYGIGVRANIRSCPWTGQIFWGSRDVPETYEESPFGMYLATDLGRKSNLKAVYQRIPQHVRGPIPSGTPGIFPQHHEIYSLRARTCLTDSWIIRGEFSESYLTRTPGRPADQAWIVSSSLWGHRSRFILDAYRSTPLYPGKLRNRNGLRAYTSYQFGKDWYLYGEGERYHDNTDDVAYLPTITTDKVNIGTYFTASDPWPALNIYGQYLRNHSDLIDPITDRCSRTITGLLYKAYDNVTVTGSATFGIENDYFNDISSPLQRYRLRLLGRFKNFSYVTSGAYQHVQNPLHDRHVSLADLSLGRKLGDFGTANAKISYRHEQLTSRRRKKERRVEFTYRKGWESFFHTVYYRYRDRSEYNCMENDRVRAYYLSWKILYRLCKDSELSLTFSSSDFLECGRDFTTILSFRTFFDAPVPFVRSKSQLTGRLFLDGPEDSGSLSKTRLTLGDRSTYTNSRGEFTFPAIAPGVYPLEVDTSTLPANFESASEGPREVILRKGYREAVDVEIVVVAGLRGKIDVLRAKGPLADRGPLPPQRLLLKKGGAEVAEAFSDSRGQFFLSNLRPGRYQLSLDSAYLPQNYVLEGSPTLEIDLAAGQKIEDLTFQIREKERELQVKTFPKAQGEQNP